MTDHGEDINQPVVIDNGSGVIKAGIAGADAPKCVFQNFTGKPKHVCVMTGALEGEFIGPRAQEYRGLLKLRYPIEHGIINHWDDMEQIWKYLYSSKEQLNLNPEEHPVLLTEPPLNPRRNREHAAEIFFEAFQAPALFVSMQAVLSLYATGRTTGVVLDSGDGVTHAVPIFEGFALNHAMMRSDTAGRDVTRYLQLLLRKEGHIFRTSAEFEIVRTIKELSCYVTGDIFKEERNQSEPDRNNDANNYVLPDGRSVKIGASRFRAPEVLFSPDLIGEESDGIHEVLANSILRADTDLRKTLYSSIVLSGGSTMFKGFGDRLVTEVKKLSHKDTKIKIGAPTNRTMTTWIGGSILASLSTFKKMWVSKQEYFEDNRVLSRKTFL